MRLGAGQSGVKLALLSRLGAASGATNNQGLFLLGFHDYMMQDCPATSWSIVTSALTSEPSIFGFVEFVSRQRPRQGQASPI
jgi:hypothetical protein